MLIGYIVGALTALVSVSLGFLFGKPYLDRWQNKALQKPAQPKQGGATP